MHESASAIKAEIGDFSEALGIPLDLRASPAVEVVSRYDVANEVGELKARVGSRLYEFRFWHFDSVCQKGVHETITTVLKTLNETWDLYIA